jgi:aspartate carbamoyltransferase regulatory subunit
MAKKTKVQPTYLSKTKSLKMGLHDVMRALQVIEDHGHTEKFKRAAKKKKLPMIVPADTVNFVKDFLVKNKMHDDPIGKHIVNAKGPKAATATGQGAAAAFAATRGDRFDCRFR